jgi:hypothetical protein
MLIPLKQFICDSCGEIIQRPEQGWIEWLMINDSDKGLTCGKFRICHHRSFSPYKTTQGCYNYIHHPDCADMHLHHYLDQENKTAFNIRNGKELSISRFQGVPALSSKEHWEFTMRLEQPYYEEARLYLRKAQADNFFPPDDYEFMFDKNKLKLLIEEYNVWL